MGNTYNPADFRRITRRIRAVADRTEDLSKVWPRVGAYLSRQVRRQFSTRGKHFGTPWKPLARSTRKQKRELGFPRIPLVRTGGLRRSFIDRPMDIEVYRKQSATYGSSLDKAVWQQKGTKRNGRPHIPPRPILEVGPQQRKEVADIIRKHIAGRSVNPK